MTTFASVAVAFVALLHVGFLVLEMFLWKKPYGGRRFGLSRDEVEATASLAANQGLYNGFLAAGLVWSLIEAEIGTKLAVFFLSCVVIAGIYGAATAARRIIFIQALPAAVALALVLAR